MLEIHAIQGQKDRMWAYTGDVQAQEEPITHCEEAPSEAPSIFELSAKRPQGTLYAVKKVSQYSDEVDSGQIVALDNGILFDLKWFDGSFYEGEEVILIPKKEDTSQYTLIKKHNPDYSLRLHRVEGNYHIVL